MFKVKIKNIQGADVFREFDTEVQADEWIQELTATQHWGRNAWLEVIPAHTDQESGEWIEEQTIPHDAEWSYEILDLTAEYAAKRLKAKRLNDGALARQACDSAIDYVAGFNLERELTPEQITQMTTQFGGIMLLLAVHRRPGEARKQILLVEPDGVIVTQSLKDDLLEILKEF